MDNQYVLPVQAVVEMIKDMPDKVMLQASFASLAGISKEACLAHIMLGQGQVFSCTILLSRTGTILCEQHQAYQVLERCGDVLWSVLSPPSWPTQALQTAIVPSRRASIPLSAKVPALRVAALTPEHLEPFTTAYRRVVLLVDGKRSLDTIASLLQKTPQEIQQMLETLPHLIHW